MYCSLRPVPEVAAAGPARRWPNRSPETTVKAFLAAARDTNLTLMASYWGGSSGPAATSKQPPDYEKRIRVLQKYLVSDSAKVASLGTVDGHPDQIMVRMRMFVGNCQNSVPFIVGKWKDQYIINDVDITMTATPGRPCDDTGEPDVGCPRPADSLGELDQDAGGGLWVEECNATAARADPGRLVDQAIAGLRGPGAGRRRGQAPGSRRGGFRGRGAR